MLPQKAMLSVWDSFSALLAAQGLSPTWLFVGLGVFFIILLLSLREFLCWYLKIYQTQNMIADLQKQIVDLQSQSKQQPLASPKTTTEPLDERPVDRFVHFN
jgi:hypothetical protein